MTHIYRGDRWTDPSLRGVACTTVKRADGKAIRGRNANILLETADGRRFVGTGYQLRKATT